MKTMMKQFWALAVLTVVAVAVVFLYFHFKPEPAPVGAHVGATPAPEVRKEETVPLQIEVVKVFRPEVKKKLGLPEPVQQAPEKQVVASTLVAADEHPHTVTTVIDTGTGGFTSYDRVEPLPWVSVNTKTQVGVFYGIKSGTPTLRLQAQQEFLQIKALHLGATASADIGGGTVDPFVGIGAWARW